jgi:hypothetical protein
MTTSHSQSWAKSLALMLVSCLIVLFVFEIGLRLAGFSYPSFVQMDSDLGYRERPGAEGWQKTEGVTWIKNNNAGLADREHSLAKPAGTFRIAILGDSMMEARQVPFAKSFSAQLEHDLVSCGALQGKTPEVINFGVSGYGTSTELIMLRKEVWRYSPDMVILAFTTANDVSDNTPRLSDNITPHFYIQNGQLVQDNSYAKSRSFAVKNTAWWRAFIRLSDYFRTLQLLNKAKNSAQVLDASKAASGSNSKKGAGADLGLYQQIFLEPRSDEWREAWEVTERLIQTIHQEVEAKGAKFLLVSLSVGIQVDPRADVRAKFAHELGVPDLFYTDKRIEELAKRDNIDAVILAPAMLRYAEAHNTYLHGFSNTQMGVGHWNENGHRVGAEMVAEHMCDANKTIPPTQTASFVK